MGPFRICQKRTGHSQKIGNAIGHNLFGTVRIAIATTDDNGNLDRFLDGLKQRTLEIFIQPHDIIGQMLGLMAAGRNTDHIGTGFLKYFGHRRRLSEINTAFDKIIGADTHAHCIIIAGLPLDLLNQFHNNAGAVLQTPAEFIGSQIKLGGQKAT